VPARFGIAAALRTARACHALTALALAATGWALGLGVLYWIGWLVVVGLLVYDHSLVSSDDLSRLDMAFFNVNGYISVITFVAAVAGLWY
jgi:4-hydroxybenzoate polyprenyltransferase